jgi:methionine synthase (B12-dependent) (EC 2.1.1.13)
MTREAFRELVKKGPVLLDGATGTNLQKAGMPVGVCPEQWILENSEVLIDLQKQYVEAGTDILFAPTFTASRIKLKEYGLEDHLEEMNRKLVALSKEAAKGTNALVAGDLTMTGEQLYPLGDLMFEDLVDVYKEQAKIIAEAGADLFVVETMMSLQECRAAVLAIREVCDLPVMVSLTYNEDGRTLYGTDPVTAVVVMQSLGADAVGMNCSTGPEAMLEPIAKMAEYAAIPLLAKPNAGMPELIDGQTVFNVEPEEFAEVGKKLVEEGAAIIGGCCGTTPEHIRALKEAVKGIPVKAPLQTKRRMLTSERKSVEITLDGRFMVIGERINPTGKKKLQAELKEGSLNLVRTMALEQEENGASILDINMGMNGIDEKEMMLRTIYEVTSTVDCPLCIDSSHVDIIEAALRIYPGRALINSISLEKEKFEKLLPIAKKYGAMFILLPLSDEGLPKDSAEKHGIIHTIMDEAVRIGMAKEDIIVDGLVATIGANPNAALECFETFSYCKNELELPTACGLSNISFGLPERTYVNTAFLTMAIANGLTMAIANPSQELLINAAFASDMLLNKKESDIRYIERMNFLSEKYAGMERVMVQKTPAGTSAAGGEIRKESTGSGVF